MRCVLVLAVSMVTTIAHAQTVLIYTAAAEERLPAREVATDALTRLAEERGFTVDVREDPAAFASLDEYAAVVFLLTTGDVLEVDGEAELRRFVEDGGGFWVSARPQKPSPTGNGTAS